MNYRGSYRRLLGNAKAALIASIELYNKPTFSYRDECCVILLINAWELFLKAILSRNNQSVFYAKKRNQPYRTLSWQDAFGRTKPYFPPELSTLAIQRNLELLGTYRDNAVHFYNAPGFGVVVYALAQTSVKNFRDMLESIFAQRLENEINWHLLPLGIEPPMDVIEYIAGSAGSHKTNSAVKQFLTELAAATDEVKNVGGDTGQLMTIFSVKLESVKKIGDADVLVGVDAARDGEGPLVVTRTQDPNKTHPLRQTEIVDNIANLHGRRFTSHTFQAIAWKYDLKNEARFCWKASEGVLTKYSRDVIALVKKLSAADVDAALTDYRRHLGSKAKTSSNASQMRLSASQ